MQGCALMIYNPSRVDGMQGYAVAYRRQVILVYFPQGGTSSVVIAQRVGVPMAADSWGKGA